MAVNPCSPGATFHDEQNQHLLFVKYAAPGSISTCVMDEAHNLRSRKVLYHGCLQLGKAALVRVALTATPFVTGPRVRSNFHWKERNLGAQHIQDMITIGKVLQIPECSSSTADRIETDIGSRRGRPVQLNDQNDYVDLCSSNQTVAEEIIQLFGDRIIRRDLASLQHDQSPIIPLPPIHHVKLELSMFAHDRMCYQELMKADLMSKRQSARLSRQVRRCHHTISYQ